MRTSPPAPADPAILADRLGVNVDAELLERALTHRSYAYEHGGLPHNERLEFLGDSVLGVVITEALYRTHPDLPEGKLAKLRASVVNMRALAEVAQSIGGEDGLGAYVRLGRGEEATGGRSKASILADTLEAVIGAVYLEHGLVLTQQVIHDLFDPMLEAVANNGAGTGLEDKPAGVDRRARPGCSRVRDHLCRPGSCANVHRAGLGQRRDVRPVRGPQQEGSRTGRGRNGVDDAQRAGR